MKNFTKLFALAVVFILISTASSFAQTSVTSGAATASGEIVTSLSLTKDADMYFGKFTISGLTGTLLMSNVGVLTGSTAATPVNGTPTSAKFTVSGSNGSTYSYSLPTSVTLNRVGGGPTLILNALTIAAVTGQGTIGNISVGTSQQLNVGGTLNFDGDETVGVYNNTSDLKLTVDYN